MFGKAQGALKKGNNKLVVFTQKELMNYITFSSILKVKNTFPKFRPISQNVQHHLGCIQMFMWEGGYEWRPTYICSVFKTQHFKRTNRGITRTL